MALRTDFKIRFAFIFMTMLTSACAFAQSPTIAPTTQPAPAPDSIDEDRAEAQQRPAGILKYGPVSLVDPLWKDLNKQVEPIGLKVGLAYTAAYQRATEGPGQRDAAGGDADLFGDWRL